jgi:predicted TPR repeat methyltransferase
VSQVDEGRLNELVGRVLGDVGGAVSVPLVRIGDALGLYRTIEAIGPATAEQIAETAGCALRYVREWLAAQAASGYVNHEHGRFSLTPEQALVFAEPDSPVNLIGAFDTAAAMVDNQAKVQTAFKTGRGVAWGDQASCMFCAVARLFRPGYVNALVQDWLPALDGVVDKLKAGAKVADVGCGHGLSTIVMAQAFPRSNFTGYDFHSGSIAAATAHARSENLTNVRFEVGRAQDFAGGRLGSDHVLRLPARHG